MCCPLSVADGTLNPQPASTHRETRRRWGIGRATKSVCYRTRALTQAVLLPRERRETQALLLLLVSSMSIRSAECAPCPPGGLGSVCCVDYARVALITRK